MERVQRDADPYFTIYNLGINGDTTRGLVRRFEGEAGARFVAAERNIVVFSIGLNDAVLLDDEEFQIPPNEYRMNISSLIHVARKFGQIALIGLTPVDESKTTPILWQRRWYYRNDQIREYDQVLQTVAAEEKILFIDTLSAFADASHPELLDDGLHPNSRGHQRLFEVIRRAREKGKFI